MMKYTKPTILQFTLKHCMIWKHFHGIAQILDRETHHAQNLIPICQGNRQGCYNRDANLNCEGLTVKEGVHCIQQTTGMQQQTRH